jgi:hypothetical protein
MDAQSYFKLGSAIFKDGDASLSRLSIPFFDAAESHAESELQRLSSPPVEGNPSLQVLRDVIEPLYQQGRNDIVLRTYGALCSYEIAGSTGQYRARMKYAEMLADSDRRGEALERIDSMIADANRGYYTDVNWKDVDIARWNICAALGELDTGLTGLRDEVRARQGTRFEARIRETLIWGLIDTSHFEEAKSQLAELAEMPRINPDKIKSLGNTLALAQAKQARSGK